MSDITGKQIAVWFSCGCASAVAAILTHKKYGKKNIVRILNNPVKEEHEDNLRFKQDVENFIGIKIEKVINPKYPDTSCQTVWKEKRYMAGIKGATCTTELKRRARQEWENKNPHDYLVLGFTVEEKQRHENFILTERNNLLPVLIHEGLTKQDCFNYILSLGIKPPEAYYIGLPNANCIGCVKATSPTYWNFIRKHFPETFRERAILSREIGCKLTRYKGKRLFLDELPPDARGKQLKSMQIECSSFCEENVLIKDSN